MSDASGVAAVVGPAAVLSVGAVVAGGAGSVVVMAVVGLGALHPARALRA